MKKSIYNFETSYNDIYIIYNSRTQACILMDQAEYALYARDLPCENQRALFDLGIYVPDDINETQLVLNCINENIENDFHAIRSHTVYTTTNCNARCPYCFENGVAKKNMSEQTARDVAEYILSNQGDAKKLYVIWFGGEPMLNVKAADTIAATIKSSISNDVEFRSSMYTNGYLFSKEAIEHAICYWNLKAVQITLDGMKETYERIKKLPSADSFERIIRNIKEMLKAGLRVQVRLNYDESNYQEVLLLIEYLSKEFGNAKNLYVYAYKIFSFDNPDNSKLASSEYDFNIIKKLTECGFCDNIISTIKGNSNTCLAGSKYSKIYLPDGSIIKCNRALDSRVGDIYGNIDDSEIEKWNGNRLQSSCYSCKLLPVCGGGCILEFLNGKNGCMNSEASIIQRLQYYIRTNVV